MITVSRTWDEILVHQLLTHPDIWEESKDDGAAPVEDFLPQFPDSVYYLVPYDGKEAMGIFVLTPSNSSTWEWHTGILRKYRGKRAVIGCRLAVDWMSEHSPALKLITWVECEARHVYLFARACGFGIEGTSHGSILKGGRLRDQYLMGRLLCQSQQ